MKRKKKSLHIANLFTEIVSFVKSISVARSGCSFCFFGGDIGGGSYSRAGVRFRRSITREKLFFSKTFRNIVDKYGSREYNVVKPMRERSNREGALQRVADGVNATG